MSLVVQRGAGGLYAGPAQRSTLPATAERSTVGNNITWQSHLYDWDSDLILARARVLDPFSGLYLTRDPLGYEDSVNLYALNRWDPVNLRDPTGMSVCDFIDVSIGVGDSTVNPASACRAAGRASDAVSAAVGAGVEAGLGLYRSTIGRTESAQATEAFVGDAIETERDAIGYGLVDKSRNVRENTGGAVGKDFVTDERYIKERGTDAVVGAAETGATLATSFWALFAAIERGVLAGPGRAGVDFRKLVPAGFRDAEQFAKFRSTLRKGLKKAKIKDTKPILAGSAVRGTDLGGRPFGTGSDFDIALVGPSLFRKAERLGFEMGSSPARILVSDAKALKKLGLDKVATKLGRVGGHQVNFLLFKTEDNFRKFSDVGVPLD